jgi:hypothetical protein
MTPDPHPVTPERARELLRAAAPGRSRPVDRLIERLERADGAEWFEGVIERFTRHAAGRRASDLLDGRLPLEAISAAKERAKTLLAEATSPEDELAATACYFTTCAAAQARHHARIHSDESGAVEASLVDLADALPEEWGTLARAAAEGSPGPAEGEPPRDRQR